MSGKMSNSGGKKRKFSFGFGRGEDDDDDDDDDDNSSGEEDHEMNEHKRDGDEDESKSSETEIRYQCTRCERDVTDEKWWYVMPESRGLLCSQCEPTEGTFRVKTLQSAHDEFMSVWHNKAKAEVQQYPNLFDKEPFEKALAKLLKTPQSKEGKEQQAHDRQCSDEIKRAKEAQKRVARSAASATRANILALPSASSNGDLLRDVVSFDASTNDIKKKAEEKNAEEMWLGQAYPNFVEAHFLLKSIYVKKSANCYPLAYCLHLATLVEDICQKYTNCESDEKRQDLFPFTTHPKNYRLKVADFVKKFSVSQYLIRILFGIIQARKKWPGIFDKAIVLVEWSGHLTKKLRMFSKIAALNKDVVKDVQRFWRKKFGIEIPKEKKIVFKKMR